MTRVLLALFVLSLATAASPAAAQDPTSGTVFVTGSGYGAIRWAPTNDDYGTTASGAVPAGALGVGVHLTPRVSARVEFAMTGRLEDTAAYPSFPTEPYPFGGGVLASWTPLPTDGSFISGISLPAGLSLLPAPTERRQSKAGFALLGYHLNAGRASIELLGGVGLVHQRVTHITEAWIAIYPPQGLPYETTYGRHSAVPVIGADAAVRLAGQVALVPQVRAYVQEGSLNVWPGLGLRWTF